MLLQINVTLLTLVTVRGGSRAGERWVEVWGRFDCYELLRFAGSSRILLYMYLKILLYC